MRNTLSGWIERKLAERTPTSTGTSASSAATWTTHATHRSAPARSSAGTAPSRPGSSRCPLEMEWRVTEPGLKSKGDLRRRDLTVRPSGTSDPPSQSRTALG